MLDAVLSGWRINTHDSRWVGWWPIGFRWSDDDHCPRTWELLQRLRAPTGRRSASNPLQVGVLTRRCKWAPAPVILSTVEIMWVVFVRRSFSLFGGVRRTGIFGRRNGLAICSRSWPPPWWADHGFTPCASADFWPGPPASNTEETPDCGPGGSGSPAAAGDRNWFHPSGCFSVCPWCVVVAFTIPCQALWGRVFCRRFREKSLVNSNGALPGRVRWKMTTAGRPRKTLQHPDWPPPVSSGCRCRVGRAPPGDARTVGLGWKSGSCGCEAEWDQALKPVGRKHQKQLREASWKLPGVPQTSVAFISHRMDESAFSGWCASANSPSDLRPILGRSCARIGEQGA